MTTALSNLAASLLNRCPQIVRYALPQSCLLCGALSGRDLVCGRCDVTLPRLGAAVCKVCALPIPTGSLCGPCLASPPHYKTVTAVFAYAFPVDALIHALKYGGNLAVARFLGETLIGAIRHQSVDVIVPMPLSAERLRERGFNQSLEIARYVAAATRVSIAEDLVLRPRHAAAQASLPWNERERNVRGAFVCTDTLNGLRIAVIDDVMTTGATLKELARTLRRAGALEVNAWMVARALKTTPF
jgi:ComF family protein